MLSSFFSKANQFTSDSQTMARVVQCIMRAMQGVWCQGRAIPGVRGCGPRAWETAVVALTEEVTPRECNTPGKAWIQRTPLYHMQLAEAGDKQYLPYRLTCWPVSRVPLSGRRKSKY